MNAHMIYSYGYHGRQVAELDNLSRRLNAVVVDTRYSPRSRDPQWARSALQRVLGDRYEWMPEFGNVLYTTDAIKLNDPEAGIDRIRPVIEDQPVVLLCMCPRWSRCHRADVAALLSERFGVAVHHLGASGIIATDPQTELFGSD